MAQLLPRFYRRQLEREDAAAVAKAVAEGELVSVTTRTAPGATAAGDPRRLRGIPAIGRGCPGAIPGTSPGANLLRR